MCGIVGIVGVRPVAGRLVDALKRLEYRGYDSAGIAVIEEGELVRRRAPGKLENLRICLADDPVDGVTGIAHTRWATHGVPNEANAHPHIAGDVAVVHNGIIENFAELRAELTAKGVSFSSDTDTEVVARLLDDYRRAGMAPRDAVLAMLQRVTGAFALVILFKDRPDTLFVARYGPPLAIGHGDDEMYVGSDAIALAPLATGISYLEDGDMAIVDRDGAVFCDFTGEPVRRQRQPLQLSSMMIDKGNHRHFMEKEIFDQPEVISHTLGRYCDFAADRTAKADDGIDFSDISRLTIAACGTAYLSGLIGKYWIERYARLPVEIDVASEFRYRELPISDDTLALFISQSGETADTLASLRYCKEQGAKTGALVNVTGSTIAREADAVFPILAGPEISVASTKAFTCQLALMASLALRAGRERGTLSPEDEKELVHALSEVPRLMSQVLHAVQPQIEKLSRELSHFHHVLYLGRGTSFPLAMEGALKLKEITYIHAEGYAAGELKHGPIALIDENMPVIVIAPHDRFFEKTVSNMQEVAARDGKIVFITDESGARASELKTMQTIVLPDMPEFIAPMVFSLPIQLLAYHTAVFMGTDADQPRNLAKAVTVE
ncbi:glutamine--fructose-6-phosphate transaminase (isomerizing) [Martelella mediterranea]|uniref:glutamine--fructose-6-phosphate transaminase (isomerizing) n=1 Tax=Martelella mediterranea TaxID=293089 RepID=UPI001E30B0BF|nr:glutamine--fructose-6-phosphate transaminase (isomerizing) [Martelella mediterranea]MCD1636670.1 glutamine--fructose-6-phosphate transaminase (isomerizing) [Martelella mediterranea]